MSRRERLLAREIPTRYETLDPEPLSEAILPERPRSMRQIVEDYVRVDRLEAYYADEDSAMLEQPEHEAWFDDGDDEDRILSEHQVLDMAFEPEGPYSTLPTDDIAAPAASEAAEPRDSASLSENEAPDVTDSPEA